VEDDLGLRESVLGISEFIRHFRSCRDAYSDEWMKLSAHRVSLVLFEEASSAPHGSISESGEGIRKGVLQCLERLLYMMETDNRTPAIDTITTTTALTTISRTSTPFPPDSGTGMYGGVAVDNGVAPARGDAVAK
jgi:hypothetical protein